MGTIPNTLLTYELHHQSSHCYDVLTNESCTAEYVVAYLPIPVTRVKGDMMNVSVMMQLSSECVRASAFVETMM
jgi:hypothetical protein